MNSISNIWNHPRTSAAGLLISIVTIAGVLSQQGVTLGHVGTGSVVTLVCGLGSALLGLLARDPSSLNQSSGNPSPLSNSTAKLGAWALIALLLPLPFVGGCSGTIDGIGRSRVATTRHILCHRLRGFFNSTEFGI